MSLYIRQVLTLLKKDLTTEFRTKERLSAMCFFALLVVLIFNFAFKPNTTPGWDTPPSAAMFLRL